MTRHGQNRNHQNHRGGGNHVTADLIHAPYNFVPLHSKVFIPDWATRVSHDRPFRDGLCGELEFEITAHEPILVGNEHKPATAQAPGEVHFHKAPDGRYMIPGSSLSGMLRNVLEIAAFGRMRFVDDVKLGARDLSAGARDIYGSNFTRTVGNRCYEAKSKSGWLVFENGEAIIEPCAHSRVEQSDLEAVGDVNLHFARPTPAKRKYESWLKGGNSLKITFSPGPVMLHQHQGKQLKYSKANLSAGASQGRLVFTGQPGSSKHMEFIFHGSLGGKVTLEKSVWRAFIQVHESSDDWQYWKNKSRDGEKIPVFFLEDGKRISDFGLAQMFKLAYQNSIHDVIKNSKTEHLADKGDDLPALLFGYTDQDKGAGNLKCRASFTPAFAMDSPKPVRCNPTILNGPKSSYFPNYLEQPQSVPGKLQGNSYSTYMDDNARIRGFKRYPVRPNAQVQSLTPEQRNNKRVQTVLHPLPRETRFVSKLKFHNLKPVELGALVWALTWGGRDKLRHSIGMGRPFGFGQISAAIRDENIHPNDHQAKVPSLDECMKAFTTSMDDHVGSSSWNQSIQMVELLAMANPSNANGKNLTHMKLSPNEFVSAKKARLVLPSYTGSIHAKEEQPQASEPVPITEQEGGATSVDKVWLDQTIQKIMSEQPVAEADVLRSKPLAEAWNKIEEKKTKQQVLKLIRDNWSEKGWWDHPPGKASKRAKAIYDSDETDLTEER